MAPLFCIRLRSGHTGPATGCPAICEDERGEKVTVAYYPIAPELAQITECGELYWLSRGVWTLAIG
jgi:hypothetical protein